MVGSLASCDRKFHTLQESPRLPPLCCAEFPADIQPVKICHKSKNWQLCNVSQPPISVKYFIHLFIVFEWSIRDSHQDASPVLSHKHSNLLSLSLSCNTPHYTSEIHFNIQSLPIISAFPGLTLLKSF